MLLGALVIMHSGNNSEGDDMIMTILFIAGDDKI